MNSHRVAFLLFLLVASFAAGESDAVEVIATKGNSLDRYVAQPDPSYSWKVARTVSEDGLTTFVVDLTSQTWRTKKDVDRPVWKHWLVITKPDNVVSNKAMVMIGGGSNGRPAPKGPKSEMKQLALASGAVVAELGTIPNQRLEFHGDGKMRSEDDLIAYTWDQYLKTGDDTWPARLPMVKSVVRAMDTIQELLASEQGGNHKIEEFVIAGGSKRGWTTWLTAAVDSRVVAIIPIVIDVLNLEESMRHHYAAYGFWAPAVGDYVRHKITQRMNTPRHRELMNLVDPFAYRHRLTMPKFILNASGDQFFLPDSSQFYFNELPGEKLIRYVPNADHSLNGTDALQSLLAYYQCILSDTPRPKFSWKLTDDGAIHVKTTSKPLQVKLWQATNPKARDFRVRSIGRAYRD